MSLYTNLRISDGHQMMRSAYGYVYHIIEWCSEDGSVYHHRALCNKKSVKYGMYPDGTVPSRYYREEVDLEQNVCSTCFKRYENAIVRQLRKDLDV